jgi:hypothetical protein
MRAAGFVGAVTDASGEYLRVVTPRDLETLEPGLYSLALHPGEGPEQRLFTGRVWSASTDTWIDLINQPQELLVRIMATDMLPLGVDARAYNRPGDGKGVVIFWVSELAVPDAREADFVPAPE